MLLITVPIAAFIVFVLGIFLGGWWIGLVVLAIYFIALALGVVVAGLFIGRLVLGRLGRPGLHFAWALLVGLVILTLVSLIPIAGGIVMFFAVLFGLGALAVAAVRARRGAAPEAP